MFRKYKIKLFFFKLCCIIGFLDIFLGLRMVGLKIGIGWFLRCGIKKIFGGIEEDE